MLAHWISNEAYADDEDEWMTSDRDELNELDETPVIDADNVIEPTAPAVEPTSSEYILPADRPGASATTGTGTSIAVGCTAVCAVILLITILILTIVS